MVYIKRTHFCIWGHSCYCVVYWIIRTLHGVRSGIPRMATYQISAPTPLDFFLKEWRLVKRIRRFERFRQSSELGEENQINTLIYSKGDTADDIYQSFWLSEEDANKYDLVKPKFEEYFTKQKNVIYEQAKFNRRRQEEGESVDSIITALYSWHQIVNMENFTMKWFETES